MTEFQSMLEMFRDASPSASSKLGLRLNGFLDGPNNDSAGQYISEYFNARSKGCIFDVEISTKKSLFKKSAHMLSAFMLGMSLRSLVEQSVRQQLLENTELELRDFEYPWMLCCLYHDILSEFERAKDIAYADLDDFCTKADIAHSIYDTNLPNGVEISPIAPTYAEGTVKRYFAYRQNCEKNDHGITAGYLAFDKLVKNYLCARDRNNNQNIFWTKKDGHNLRWHKDQIWVFAYAADAIIAHNIWHKPSDEGWPKEITLDSSEERKLNINYNPLSYFCSLVDTIEPVKAFEGVNAKTIFENLLWKLDGKSITIRQSNAEVFDMKLWYDNRIKGMECWMDGIRTDYCPEEGEIVIHI